MSIEFYQHKDGRPFGWNSSRKYLVVVENEKDFSFAYDDGSVTVSACQDFPEYKTDWKQTDYPKDWAQNKYNMKTNKDGGSTGVSTPVNTERDWVTLAKDGLTMGLPSRHVYIGKGNDKDLANIFSYGDIYSVNDRTFGWRGNGPTWDYSVLVEEWEKVLGLNYTEATKGETPTLAQEVEKLKKKRGGVWTKATPSLVTLLVEIAKEKEIHIQFGIDHSLGFVYFTETGNGNSAFVGTINDDTCFRGYEEVSRAEIIQAIENDKGALVFKGLVRGYDVKVSEEGVSAGCQFYDREEFKELARRVEEYRQGILVKFEDRYDIKVGPEGLDIDGRLISFADFTKVVEATK